MARDPGCRGLWLLAAIVLLIGIASPAKAEIYWLDNFADPNRTHYATGEEACFTGVLQRSLEGYRSASTQQYRLSVVNIGPDNGIDERVCRGVIERGVSGFWVTVELIDTRVFGPRGNVPPCSLPGLADPETRQCGIPKCDGGCPPAGGNGSNPIDSATGNKRQIEVDYEGGGAFPLRFERAYNSMRARDNAMLPLGAGWTHNYLAKLVPVTDSVGNVLRIRAYRTNGAIQVFSSNGSGWVSDADVPERLSAILTDGELTSATYTRGDDTVESYDNSGRLVSIKRRDGLTQTLSYSTPTGTSPYVQRVTDPDGRSLSFSYGNGQLSSVSDATGVVMQFTYADGNLASAIYPDPVSGTVARTYHYNESGQTGGVTQLHALTGITDERSHRHASWGYDTSGRGVLSVHGPYATGTADRTVLAFNTNGTSTITSSLGAVRTFGFGVQHRVARLSALSAPCDDCEGAAQSRSYDPNGYPNLTTDFRGSVTDENYNASGLRTQVIEASNDATGSKRTLQTDWHASFRVPTERRTYNAANVLVARDNWTYNTRGQAVTQSSTDPVTATTRTTTFTYCEPADITAGTCPLLGLVRSVNGPRTDVTDTTNFIYYPGDAATCATAPATCPYRKGDLWTATNATGQITETLKYDGAGRPLSVQDANGVVTDMEYHPRGWLTASKVRGTNNAVETDDAITRIEYWPTGLVRKVTQPDGAFTSYDYDVAHRLTEIADNAGNKILYTLDNAGNRTQENSRDPQGNLRHALSRVFNHLGRLQTHKDAYAKETGFTYDLNGNADITTDALLRQSDNDYDPLNRLRSTLQDVGGISAETAFRYDALDNLTRVTDPKNLDTDYTYNGFSDLTRLVSPDTGTTTYTYDSAGNRKTQLDARGVTATYTYDTLNRLTAVAYSSTTPNVNVSYTYDVSGGSCVAGETFNQGRLTKIIDGSGETRYCHDRFGHMVRKTQVVNGKTFTVRYGYTRAGRLASVTYPDGMVADYVRDAMGRITEVGMAAAGGGRVVVVNQVAYYPYGPIGQWIYGNGRVLKRTHNQNYQPALVQDTTPGALDVGLAYDAAGNLTKLGTAAQVVSAPQLTFGYDGLNRLTQTRDGPTQVLIESYSYDATGNRTSFSNSAGTQAYTYPGSSHRLSQVGTIARGYDAVGNTTSIGGAAKEFVYSPNNRLWQAKQGGVLQMSYAYNGKGEQVWRRNGAGISTYTVYDEAGHWLGEYDNAGNRVQQAVWLDDLPVGLVANNLLHYVEPDHLGTPRAVIDRTRNVAVWTWDLRGEAFGSSVPNQNPDLDANQFVFNLRFPGQRFDAASGLNYNYFRDYESGTGRYAQSDPIGLKGGVSTFSYVAQGPLSFIDPSGLVRIQECQNCDAGIMADVAKSANRWCQQKLLDQRIKDVALRGCIKERCGSTLVVCDQNCPQFRCGTGPDDPNARLTRARGHSKADDPTKITLCISEKPAGGGWGTTVIHEFAHTCRKSNGSPWIHGDGSGVPNDPGVDIPSQSKCYRVN